MATHGGNITGAVLMKHWTEKYVGRKWSKDYDCLALARQVGEEQFGDLLFMPENVRWRDMTPQAAMDLATEYAVPVHPHCCDGDAVLMKVVGNRRSLGSHVGIFVRYRNKPWVLHNMEKIGVVFQSEKSLARVQLEVVGYYRWTLRGFRSPTNELATS